MRTMKLVPLLMGALMVSPTLALPAMAAEEQDLERMRDEAMAQIEADWAAPSVLTPEEAVMLMTDAGLGVPIAEADALELVKFLRDTKGTPLQEDVGKLWAARSLVSPLPQLDTVWQQGFWNAYGGALTLLYLGASTLNSNMLPHDFDLEEFYFDYLIQAGCPSWTFCYLRVVTDIWALASFDLHQSTDSILLQLPLAIEIHLHIVCSGWWCGPVIHVHIIDYAVASNAEYVFAVPALAGSPATRATDMDVLQILYDYLGTVNYQKPRELTSAQLPGLGALPPFGTPGAGDLLTTSPHVNYVGLQLPPETPNMPPVPPMPCLPAGPFGSVCPSALPSQVHVRERGSYGIVPGDSTGTTLAYSMYAIRAWNLNLAFVRVKNVGTDAAVFLPEPPMSFYYDAGSYFTGGGYNQKTVDYEIRDSLF